MFPSLVTRSLSLLVLFLVLIACSAPEQKEVQLLEEVELLDAEMAESLRQRGDALRLAADYEAAIVEYERALAYWPDHVEANAGLGAALLGLGRHEAALHPLQRAAESSPSHYWAHRLQGNAYLHLQRYALAANLLTQAYVLNPSDPHILIGIALAQGRSGQRDLALSTLQQLEDRTDDPRLLGEADTLRREFTADD